jgi:hypothetical protein
VAIALLIACDGCARSTAPPPTGAVDPLDPRARAAHPSSPEPRDSRPALAERADFRHVFARAPWLLPTTLASDVTDDGDYYTVLFNAMVPGGTLSVTVNKDSIEVTTACLHLPLDDDANLRALRPLTRAAPTAAPVPHAAR